MATATATKTSKATRKPATPKTPTGRCSLRLRINGQVYRVAPIRPEDFAAIRAFRLRKADGSTYDVSRHVYGDECTCGDFVFHRDGIDAAGCKHIKAARASGLL